ncbi:hypothetical protein SDIAM26S_04361 [Streptomyces diastaticus subsp. diastaticus]
MTTLVASDLDRTLIYSAAALGLTAPDAEAPRLLCVEVYESRPLSYLTETAAGLLAELARETLFVPTTTRTREQYRRIRLPVPTPGYAICANGGHLLVDGVADEEWNRSVRSRLDSECAPLAEVSAHLRTTADPAWLLKERVAEELFAYLVVDRAELPASWLKSTAAWADERGWTVSLQGRKVYAVPRPLTKSAAMREVARRAGADTALAAGTPCSTRTCCSPPTTPGAPATESWPRRAGRRPGSPCSPSGVSLRGRRSCAGCCRRRAAGARTERPVRPACGTRAAVPRTPGRSCAARAVGRPPGRDRLAGADAPRPRQGKVRRAPRADPRGTDVGAVPATPPRRQGARAAGVAGLGKADRVRRGGCGEGGGPGGRQPAYARSRRAPDVRECPAGRPGRPVARPAFLPPVSGGSRPAEAAREALAATRRKGRPLPELPGAGARAARAREVSRAAGRRPAGRRVRRGRRGHPALPPRARPSSTPRRTR